MSTEICYVINEKDFSLNLLHAAQVNSSALQFLLQSNLFFSLHNIQSTSIVISWQISSVRL